MRIKTKSFVEAMRSTFFEMADINLEIEEPRDFLREEEIYTDISSTIGIFGNERLSVIFTSRESSLIRIIEKITGKKVTWKDRLLTDTTGELLNILVGRAQKISVERFNFSVPITVKGKDHEVRTPYGSYNYVNSYFLSQGEKNNTGLYIVRTFR
ncbi:MAG: chemotaxis protein CheX [Leptospiraceae bacterium]|nr:chemotaxis protein CheX [Leptospiraceae bacterium]MCP5494727.1 chemotaxis protein CheX [Leptospiraceae bacterium]